MLGKKQGDERLWKAIHLAEFIARHEANIEKGRQIFDEDLLRRRQEELSQNPLAIFLLPQAKEKVAQREKREEAFRATEMGRLLWSITCLASTFGPQTGEEFEEELEREQDIEGVYEDEGLDAAWGKFQEKVNEGKNFGELLRGLRTLLMYAEIDLLHTDLPPVPPPYSLPCSIGNKGN